MYCTQDSGKPHVLQTYTRINKVEISLIKINLYDHRKRAAKERLLCLPGALVCLVFRGKEKRLEALKRELDPTSLGLKVCSWI